MAVILNLHAVTTAQFVFNGEIVEPQLVLAGIRQGCPLSPLLFILTGEVLSLAIHQVPQVVSICVPCGGGSRKSFFFRGQLDVFIWTRRDNCRMF